MNNEVRSVPSVKEPTIGHVITVLMGKANAVPPGGALLGQGMRDCSAYNAYMWAIREIRAAEEQARSELTTGAKP